MIDDLSQYAECDDLQVDVVQMKYQNPQASAPLYMPVAVVRNTPDDVIEDNIRQNSAHTLLRWIAREEANTGRAIMVGGGPSLLDHIEDVRTAAHGGTIFAANGAATLLIDHGIPVDHQVIADAKEETGQLVEPRAIHHLIASQVHPKTLERAIGEGQDVSLWHLFHLTIEALFPKERVDRGGYSIIGGGAAVGNSALVLAYVMGYREFDIYGYDSSNRDKATHAYAQPMNQFQPVTVVEWGGREYETALAMKAQAEKFQLVGRQLTEAGCTLRVHGDGLLPAMWNTDAADLSERDKYRMLWQTDAYRDFSPGEQTVPYFIEQFGDPDPDGLVIDFGCGTGRAMMALHDVGYNVLGVDFADNCRDPQAKRLSFMEWDLTHPIPVRGTAGVCTDVMEHIPTVDVDRVITNIMAAVPKCLFSISTREDTFGAMINTPLHQTVMPADWWIGQFERLGYDVPTWFAGDGAVVLIAERGDNPDE